MSSAGRRVLVIGLDGATFDLIKPWAAQGELPNLARLMARGSHGELTSTLQPTTAPAWVTFMTGVNQGKHGLYDFIRRRSDSYNLEVTNASHILAPTLFEVASRHGRKVIAINVPYTYPPPSIDGIVVSGPFVPALSPETVSPTEFYGELKELVPGYFIIADFNPHARDPMADYESRLIEGIEMRENLCLTLLERESWDLFTVVFMETDEVQHTFWSCMTSEEDSHAAAYRNAIQNIYRRIDTAIGRMLDVIENQSEEKETTVVVLSDHGAGPFKWMINLNSWLADAGFLRFRTDQRGLLTRSSTLLVKALAGAYRRHMPAPIRKRVRHRLGNVRFDRLKGEFESALITASVDWQRTLAYSVGPGGNIFVNLKGREPLGVVAPGDEYERVRTELARSLSELREPLNGEAIVKTTYRREDLYTGPHLSKAPDLVVEWTDYGYWGRGQYDSQGPVFDAQRQFDFSSQPLTGSHRMEGVLIASGQGIKSGVRIQKTGIVNLAPTILGFLGIAPSSAMDGQMITELLTSDSLHLEAALDEETADPDQDLVPYSAEEEDKISRHLKSLGYL